MGDYTCYVRGFHTICTYSLNQLKYCHEKIILQNRKQKTKNTQFIESEIIHLKTFKRSSFQLIFLKGLFEV